MKITDKLSKVDEQIIIHTCDNGYMAEITGKDYDDEWSSIKILCVTIEDVTKLLVEASTMKRS